MGFLGYLDLVFQWDAIEWAIDGEVGLFALLTLEYIQLFLVTAPLLINFTNLLVLILNFVLDLL